MNTTGEQGQCLGLIFEPFWHKFRLRVNDVIRVDGRLGKVIRVTDCAAVVLINRPVRQFTTRFDKHVRLQPSPVLVRICSNSDTEVLNRQPKKRKQHERRTT